MITPLEIRKLEFNRKMRGYDPDEVNSTLDSIAKELENQSRENARLAEKLKVTEERLNHFRLMEKTLQDSIITMQKTLEEKRRTAQQEADLIISEAKQKADLELASYSDRIKELKTEIASLENQRLNYFLRFKNFLNSQLDWLKAMEKDSEIRKNSMDPLSSDVNTSEILH